MEYVWSFEQAAPCLAYKFGRCGCFDKLERDKTGTGTGRVSTLFSELKTQAAINGLQHFWFQENMTLRIKKLKLKLKLRNTFVFG